MKGGGKMELWSRYFHQMLALQDSTVKCGPVKVKVKSESEKWSRYFHQMLALQDSTFKCDPVKVKSEKSESEKWSRYFHQMLALRINFEKWSSESEK